MSFDVNLKEPEAAGPESAAAMPPHHVLASAFILCLSVSCLRGLAPAAAAFGLSLATLWFRRRSIPAGRLKRALAASNLFLIFLWLTLPLGLDPAGSLFSLGPLHVREAGLRQALIITLKANSVILIFMAFTGACGFEEICSGLRALRVPERLITLLRLVARHIFTLAEEWRRLATAARLRGFTPRCDRHTYRTAANLMGMLLVRTHGRAERIHKAMLLRGFSGSFPALLPEHAGNTSRGWLLLGLACFFSAFLLFFDVARP